MSLRLFAGLLRRPRGLSLIALGIALSGLLAWRSLPVAAIPAVDLPTIVVNASLPGAGPETMASLVATPLERRIGAIPGVDEITSNNVLGATQITIQFDLTRDMDGAANDVQSAIDAARLQLPRDLPAPPTLTKINPVSAPVLFVALTSETLPISRLFDLTQAVALKLSQVPGVGRAMVQGAEKSAIRVRADPSALAAMGLGLEDVRNAIRTATVFLPNGSVQDETTSWSVATNDQLSDVESFRALIVAMHDGRPVRLDQVATVSEGPLNTRTAGWYNGRRAVFVFVAREAGANIVATARRVRAILPQFSLWLPGSIRIEIIADRSETVLPMVKDAEIAVVLTALLVICVVFLGLCSTRAAAIVSLNIPLSLLATLAMMQLLGFSLDMMSIGALAISVGLVVDDAIVMAENIARLSTAGASRPAAALRSIRQVGFTIVAITVSLMVTMAPLLLAPGPVGVLVGEFAATICIAIGLSGLLSLTLTPALCAAWLPAPQIGSGRQGLARRGYAASLRWSLDRPLLMFATTLALCALTLALYAQIPKGFLPLQDSGLIFASFTARDDISFNAMAKRQVEAMAVIRADPAVQSVSGYLGAQDATGENIGRAWIVLKPPAQRGVSLQDAIARLRTRLASLPGATAWLTPIEDLHIGTQDGSLEYSLTDESFEELQQSLPRILAALRAVSGIVDVSANQPSLALQARVEIRRDATARLGATPALIDQTLYDAFGQRQVASIIAPLDQTRVVLESAEADRRDADAPAQMFIPIAPGGQVPLLALARLSTRLTAPLIRHQGQIPAATISFALAPGAALGRVVNDIAASMADLRLPGRLHAGFAGNARAFQLTSFGQPIIFGVALLAVYLVLGILYESTIHPLTILSTLPSAGLGALLALMLCGMQLSVVSFIGLLLLTGIVKKNAIIMVDFALQTTRLGDVDAKAAIYAACLDRFRPILMTSVTAILGAVPIALTSGLSAEFRRPLGVAVTGGLIVSQFLTLYTTPSVYVLFDRLRYRPAARRASVPSR